MKLKTFQRIVIFVNVTICPTHIFYLLIKLRFECAWKDKEMPFNAKWPVNVSGKRSIMNQILGRIKINKDSADYSICDCNLN